MRLAYFAGLLSFSFSVGFLCSACRPDAANDPTSVRSPVAASSGDTLAFGREYRHAIGASRFRLGDRISTSVDVGVARTVGSKGVFGENLKNGSILATPSAPPSPGKGKQDSTPAFVALSSDEKIHSARVLAYFRLAGLPMEEVSGTHVTTTMEGYGRKGQRPLPEDTHFVSYATHLERAVAGIPVVGSQAWATFAADDTVISEGVFWPAISTEVVAKALALSAIIKDPVRHAALRANIVANDPEVRNLQGRIVIAHTESTFDAPAVAIAAYEVVTPSPAGHVRRYDEHGSRVLLPDEIHDDPFPSSVKGRSR